MAKRQAKQDQGDDEDMIAGVADKVKSEGGHYLLALPDVESTQHVRHSWSLHSWILH